MRLTLFFILFLYCLLIFQGCKYITEDTVTIDGNFANLPEKQLYLYQILPASKPLIDSVSTDASGNFRISFPVVKTGFYSLSHNGESEIILVVTADEKITIMGDGASFRNKYSVRGSKNSELYAEYNRFTTANLNKVDSLSRIFAESRSNPDFPAMKSRLDSEYFQIFNDQKEKVISFVNNHLNSLASLLVISSDFGPNPILSEQTHPELFLKLDSALIRVYPENSQVNTFHLRMLDFKAEMADMKEHEKILKPGMPAPEIVLPNSNGKEIMLSSTHGKLTLLYFWSSWNALSRKTNMDLTSIYNQFHKSGFEIFAVSVDADAELWRKAYLLDKAYWVQVNDPTGLTSVYCKTYAVRAIPKMILIGKNGKIIAGNLGLMDLEAMIKENL
jgi:thiol-disulfide isomerase/thioredoxin